MFLCSVSVRPVQDPRPGAIAVIDVFLPFHSLDQWMTGLMNPDHSWTRLLFLALLIALLHAL
jgi:hypothetical protein